MCKFIGAAGDFGVPIKSSIRALKFMSAAAARATPHFSEANTINCDGCVESPTFPDFAALPQRFNVFFISGKFLSPSRLIFSLGCVRSGKMSDGIRYLLIEFRAQNSICLNSVSALCRHICDNLSTAFARGSFEKLECEKRLYPTPCFFNTRLMQQRPYPIDIFFLLFATCVISLLESESGQNF